MRNALYNLFLCFPFLLPSLSVGDEPKPAVQELRDAAAVVQAVADKLTDNGEDDSSIWTSFPEEPVPVGAFAIFKTTPDLKQTKWEAFARSTELPDPLVAVDTNGVDAIIETRNSGNYVVIISGMLNDETVLSYREFSVTSDTASFVINPPHPRPRPNPNPPKPEPTPAVLKHAYIVFMDAWTERGKSTDLQSLGPYAKEWSAMRSNGNIVKNVDTASEEARESYGDYISEAPTLLIFDHDKGDTWVGSRPVKNISDVRKVYKELFGKELP